MDRRHPSSASPARTGNGELRAPVRVLIVDDSITSRAMLSRIVERGDGLEVAGRLSSAEAALDVLRHQTVDVILLDLEMPGMGGLEALPRLIAAGRGACVIVVSSLTRDGAEQTLAAMSLGAADTYPKPLAGQLNANYAEALARKVRALGQRSGNAMPAERRPSRSQIHLVRSRPGVPAEVLAVGASTGGIHAFGQLLKSLPGRLGVPILVTQHLPDAFMSVLARQLTQVSGYLAHVAADDMPVLPDRILIAPGDAHLTVRLLAGQPVVRLSREPVASGCRPSVDPMFASLAETYGAGTLGIVLSGMGRDGAEGASRIVEAGGLVYAQDEPTSAVWGMPRAVAEAGLASAVLPPDQIASRVAGHLAPRAGE